ELMKETPGTSPLPKRAERNPMEAGEGIQRASPCRPAFRIAGRISPHPADWLRNVYIGSQSSSIPFFTKGAAESPTRTPEIERSTAASKRERAITTSKIISRREIRSHRWLALNPSHSDTVKAK